MEENERRFEEDIETYLLSPDGGYIKGNPQDFDRECALNKKDLFTLNLTEKNIVEDSNNISKSNINVFETEKYVFSISDVNEKQLKKFDLTVDIIKDYFSKISE